MFLLMEERVKILCSILCAVVVSVSHHPVHGLGSGDVGGPLGLSGELEP